MKRIYSSLNEALAAFGIRCRIDRPIPQTGFLRLHADGDKPGSANIAVSRCRNGLGYIKDWKKGREALFRLNEPKFEKPVPESVFTNMVTGIVAQQIFKGSALATHSGYFLRKGLNIADLRLRTITARDLYDRFSYSRLGRSNTPFVVVPIYRIELRQPVLCSLQFIGGSPAKKHFLKGGQKKSGFWPVQPIPKDIKAPVIGVAEGVATAISAWHLFKDAGNLTTVVAAFDCGNLVPVCKSLRRRWPKAKIIVFADNDRPEKDDQPNLHWSPDNAGVLHAVKACQAVGGLLHAPSFYPWERLIVQEQTGSLPTDWNDVLMLTRGLYGVKP